MKYKFVFLFFAIISFTFCHAQIEVAHVSSKEFKSTGFGGFLNFSFPISDGKNYVIAEGGFQYFKADIDNLLFIPCVAGFRYTLNQSGTGFYVEPNAGYTFGAGDLQKHTQDKLSGIATGVGIGYLFQPTGIIQFNISARYEHCFSNIATNTFSFRISHAFSFGRRRDD